jgi:hypothetical protein
MIRHLSELSEYPRDEQNFSADVFQVNVYSLMWRFHLAQLVLSKPSQDIRIHDFNAKTMKSHQGNDCVFKSILLYGSGTFTPSKSFELDLSKHGLIISDRVLIYLLFKIVNTISCAQHFCSTRGVARPLKYVAWSFPEQVKIWKQCPEVLTMDTTANTNKHDRHLIELVAMDDHGKNCVPIQGLLDSQTVSAFTWFFTSACKMLLGQDSLKCTHVVLTDDNDQEIEGFEIARDVYELFDERCRRRGCIVHRIFHAIPRLLGHVMTSEDRDYSRNFLMNVAKTSETVDQARSAIMQLIHDGKNWNFSSDGYEKFKNYLEKLSKDVESWALCGAMESRIFDRFTTNPSESEHGVLMQFCKVNAMARSSYIINC